MINRLINLYTPTYVNVVAYLLQANEYDPTWFIRSYRSTSDFSEVARNMRPASTQAFRAIKALIWVMLGVLYLGSFVFVLQGSWQYVLVGLGLALMTPVLVAYLLVVPLFFADLLIRRPRQAKMVRDATEILHSHKAIKIGVVGSYGKTTMKEILSAVLGTGAKVASTPGNYNTPIGIARFTADLDGSEDILIIEMGEYIPGDISKICEMVLPDYGVITGINEQHLQRMGSMENIVSTIFEIADFVNKDKLLVNVDSVLAERAMDKKNVAYSTKSAGKWKVSNVKAGVKGTSFTATKDKTVLKLKSKLLGEHQVGPLMAGVYMADRLSHEPDKIAKGLATTQPEGRRFNPRTLKNGATFIDDTYNGNPDGFLVGIDFLNTLKKEKTVYITGGIIELGEDKERIHQFIGERLAKSSIDRIMFIDTPATQWMIDGFKQAGTKNKYEIIKADANIYDNIEKFTSSGEVVLMQNWQREDVFYEL